MKILNSSFALYLMLGLLTGTAIAARDLTDADRARLKADNALIQTLPYLSWGSFGLSVYTAETGMTSYGDKSPRALRLGAQWVDELKLENPLDDIRRQFSTLIARDPGLTNVKHLDIKIDVSHNLKKRHPTLNEGYLLDYFGNIKLMHQEGNLSDYYLQFSVRSRLMRLEKWAEHWRGNCNIKVEDNQPRNLEALRANNAALLRSWLKRGADECTKKLHAQFLGKG